MNSIHVGIGEYAVSSTPDDEIKTFALGSCVGLIMYDRDLKIAAMAHIALPESSINADKAAKTPGYFADTAIIALLTELKGRNCRKKSIWIKMAGGASIMDDSRRFDIGRRNVLAIKKLLWKYQITVTAEDTGSDISRTLSVVVDTGEVLITSGPKKWNI